MVILKEPVVIFWDSNKIATVTSSMCIPGIPSGEKKNLFILGDIPYNYLLLY